MEKVNKCNQDLEEIIEEFSELEHFKDCPYLDKDYIYYLTLFRTGLKHRKKQEKESSDIYTLTKIFEDYLLGKPINELDITKTPENKEDVVNENHYDTFHDHVEAIVGEYSPIPEDVRESRRKDKYDIHIKFEGWGVPKNYIGILLFLVRHYNARTQKQYRNKKPYTLKYDEYEEYVEAMHHEMNNRELFHLDEFDVDFLVEEVLDFELYKEIASIKNEIGKVVASDLAKLAQSPDVIGRISHAKTYKEIMLQSVQTWRKQMDDLIQFMEEVREDFWAHIRLEYYINDEEESPFSKNEIELAKAYLKEKEIKSYAKYGEDFNKEDFKSILREIKSGDKIQEKLVKEIFEEEVIL